LRTLAPRTDDIEAATEGFSVTTSLKFGIFNLLSD